MEFGEEVRTEHQDKSSLVVFASRKADEGTCRDALVQYKHGGELLRPGYPFGCKGRINASFAVSETFGLFRLELALRIGAIVENDLQRCESTTFLPASGASKGPASSRGLVH